MWCEFVFHGDGWGARLSKPETPAAKSKHGAPGMIVLPGLVEKTNRHELSSWLVHRACCLRAIYCQIFVTSDEEDEDPDGVIDYKYGEPAHHRLVAALTEVRTGDGMLIAGTG